MKKSAESYLEKGRTEKAAGNYEQARKEFTRAIDLDPNNALAYFERGRVKVGPEYFQNAIDDFWKALDLDPNLTDVYLDIVCCNASKGYPPDDCDIENITKYIEGRPNDPNAYNERAWGYYMLGQYAEAAEDYTKAIELCPEDNGYYYFRRGCSYGRSGKLDLSLADMNRAICIDPTNPEYYYARGVLHGMLGDSEKRDRDHKTAEHLWHLKATAPEKIRELQYDRLTGSVMFDDVA